jgi:hypothetical protein
VYCASWTAGDDGVVEERAGREVDDHVWSQRGAREDAGENVLDSEVVLADQCRQRREFRDDSELDADSLP